MLVKGLRGAERNTFRETLTAAEGCLSRQPSTCTPRCSEVERKPHPEPRTSTPRQPQQTFLASRAHGRMPVSQCLGTVRFTHISVVLQFSGFHALVWEMSLCSGVSDTRSPSQNRLPKLSARLVRVGAARRRWIIQCHCGHILSLNLSRWPSVVSCLPLPLSLPPCRDNHGAPHCCRPAGHDPGSGEDQGVSHPDRVPTVLRSAGMPPTKFSDRPSGGLTGLECRIERCWSRFDERSKIFRLRRMVPTDRQILGRESRQSVLHFVTPGEGLRVRVPQVYAKTAQVRITCMQTAMQTILTTFSITPPHPPPFPFKHVNTSNTSASSTFTEYFSEGSL